MELKKEVVIVFLVAVLFLALFFNNTNITGKATTLGSMENYLQENEYLLYINQLQWIEGERVELIDVSENNDAIIKVNEDTRSISDSIIVSNGLQIEKNVAIKETSKKSFAVLKIIKVEQGKKGECKESDNGYNVCLKGTCYDDYYSMGIDDYCDGNYLREFSCEYDEYVKDVHCMRKIVKCENGCINGKCISRIVPY